MAAFTALSCELLVFATVGLTLVDIQNCSTASGHTFGSAVEYISPSFKLWLTFAVIQNAKNTTEKSEKL